ncbi:MAG: UDP-N-acetylglucosamine--N-acetylmuramyl-(pentapeptide) pyrophosphoryl-undecaprenol N-acetylglucosamine transferase [Patescibacteria group bacterium]
MLTTNKKYKVFVTGGHLTPAMAVIEELTKETKRWEIVFIGRIHQLEGDQGLSEEYRIIKKLGLKFLPLTTGRFTRVFSFETLISLSKIPLGLVTAFRYCLEEKPGIIISFGGYLALPVVVAGAILGIPTITHEQTRAIGLANRVISFFARRICVSYREMVRQFPPHKTVFTGLPIRRQIFDPPREISLTILLNYPLLYIMGGTTGASSLNELVYPGLAGLTTKYMVVHQTGRLSYERALSFRQKLSQAQQEHYLPVPYLDTLEHAWVLSRAALVVGRSGANSVGEIAATGKVAVFIPLPWSAGGEQQKNARYLVDRGSAVMLNQQKLDPLALVATIEETFSHLSQYQKRAEEIAREFPRDGARLFVKEIIAVVTKQKPSFKPSLPT